MQDAETALQILTRLYSMGINISIDNLVQSIPPSSI
jgi:hypothetical protein